jgi:hypothetical protein
VTHARENSGEGELLQAEDRLIEELRARPLLRTELPLALIERVLADSSARPHLRIVSTKARAARTPRTRGFVFALAAALALSLGYAGIRSFQPNAPVTNAPPARAIAPVLTSAELRVSEGEVFRGTAPAVLGRLAGGDVIATRAGRACFGIEPNISLCAGPNSRVVLESLRVEHVKVRVERGVLVAALEKRAPGQLFSLLAEDVTATARGTTYAVARDESGAVSVSVIEGTVGVTRAMGDEVSVGPERSLRLGLDGASDGPTTLHPHERATLTSVLAGTAPSAASAEAKPLPEAGGASDKTAPAPPSAAMLLENARRELERGNARAAHALYERLRASYPASPEARTVLVTMGKLELDLGRPERALSSFDAYLAAGGALALEAQSGKIRALRALGRTEAERQAIRQYLARFPNGFEAPAFERRLAALSNP